MACTRQGAEEWPSLLDGGQSLRRALQVKPSVRRTFVITSDDVLPMLSEACPSFREALAASLRENGEELLYAHAGALADHLLERHKAGDEQTLARAGAFIERLHVEGDPYVHNLATIGFLEGIQNVWAGALAAEEFKPYLGPVSTKAWEDLNDFWDEVDRK